MDIFNFIKNHVDILAVVQQYTTLKKAGLYWKGSCPFHEEKTGSFTVSPHRSIFYCFGCSAGGDVITFITKTENCTPIEAIKLLADRHNLTLPEAPSDQHKKSIPQSEKEQYFATCTLFSDWCKKQLEANASTNNYLKSRSININSIKSFNIGFFPPGASSIKDLISYALKRNILTRDLIATNIIGNNKNSLYSPFENRLLFPIKDHLGRLCGFGGRILDSNDQRAKYYNSKESDFFLKRSVLFGLDQAKKEIQKTTIAFLVEGYTDCIAMHQHGYINSIATLGTSCSSEHLTILSRYAETLYIVYDGDNAGIQAILRLATLCWNNSLDLKVVTLPIGQDPSSYLQEHKTIDPLINTSLNIFTFFLESIAKNFHQKSFKQKIIAVRKILTVIAEIPDRLKQDLLLQEANKSFGLPFESLKSELNRLERDAKKPAYIPKIGNTAPLKKEISPELELSNISTLEKRLFFAIMQNTELITEENEEYILACLPSPLDDIIQSCKSLNINQSFMACFQKLLPTYQKIISKILVSFEEPVKQDEFNKILHQLQKKHWKQIAKNIQLKVMQAKLLGDQKLVDSLLQRFITLKKNMTKGWYS